jgi:hypothetical protein
VVGATALAAVLVTVALGGYLWLRSYDPLAWRGGTAGGPVTSLEWTQVHDGVHDIVYYVSAEEQGTFEVGFDITNTGRLPVELEGLGAGTAFAGLQMARDGTWEDSQGAALPERIVPFEPVTVEPGAGRYLVLQVAITEETACGPNYGPGSRRVLSNPRMRYRYAGAFERTALVEPPFTIVAVCGGLPTATDVVGR